MVRKHTARVVPRRNLDTGKIVFETQSRCDHTHVATYLAGAGLVLGLVALVVALPINTTLQRRDVGG